MTGALIGAAVLFIVVAASLVLFIVWRRLPHNGVHPITEKREEAEAIRAASQDHATAMARELAAHRVTRDIREQMSSLRTGKRG